MNLTLLILLSCPQERGKIREEGSAPLLDAAFFDSRR